MNTDILFALQIRHTCLQAPMYMYPGWFDVSSLGLSFLSIHYLSFQLSFSDIRFYINLRLRTEKHNGSVWVELVVTWPNQTKTLMQSLCHTNNTTQSKRSFFVSKFYMMWQYLGSICDSIFQSLWCGNKLKKQSMAFHTESVEEIGGCKEFDNADCVFIAGQIPEISQD